jgi:hypothetical protein
MSNFEKILAENMLRFGPKNLTVENQFNLHRLVEAKKTIPELVTEANEKWKSIASSYPIWNPMMEWFTKHPNLKNTRLSLEILTGNVKSVENIESLKTARKAELDKLGEFLKTITVDDPKKTLLQNIYNFVNSMLTAGITTAAENTFEGVPMDTDSYNAIDLKKLTTVYNDIKTYFKTSGKGSFELTEQELSRLLNNLTAKVQEYIADKAWFKNKSFEKAVKQADYLHIKEGKQTITSSEFKKEKEGTPNQVYIERLIQYPAPDAPNRTNLASNFMRDDISGPSQIAVKTITNQLQSIKDEITALKKEPGKSSVKIAYIQIGAYAQTSTVRTKFGDKSGQFRRSNNIALAKKRGDDIIEFGETKVKEIFNTELISKTNPITNPNVGPEWESVGGTFADGSPVTIENYGIMFQAAYKKDPTLTPRKFYIQRFNKNNERQGSIEMEYQKVFGPMRMSMLIIKIGLVYNEISQSPGEEFDFVSAYSNNFSATIGWYKFKIKINMPRWKIFKKAPPRKVFTPNWSGPNECPIFS